MTLDSPFTELALAALLHYDTCTLYCYRRLIDFSELGFDAVIDIAGARWVTFSSATTGINGYDLSTVCTGADCEDPTVVALNSDIPTSCALSIEWPLSHIEDAG